MIKIYCDFCGREMNTHIYKIRRATDDKEMDLCEDCYNKLYNKENKEDNEDKEVIRQDL